ncbi:hypothetical protein GGR56DRAFT_637428 [Xylariaceae sp. FL0804]|nr:hypothetical protein GGR56DRAFT_637428 [Xylariaceae sp. FL0804]
MFVVSALLIYMGQCAHSENTSASQLYTGVNAQYSIHLAVPCLVVSLSKTECVCVYVRPIIDHEVGALPGLPAGPEGGS